MYNNYSFLLMLILKQSGSQYGGIPYIMRIPTSTTKSTPACTRRSRRFLSSSCVLTAAPTNNCFLYKSETRTLSNGEDSEEHGVQQVGQKMVCCVINRIKSSQLPTEPIISVPNRTNHLITVSVKVCAAHVVETTVCLLLSE